jgi:peptidoglycan/LPS O-acetylase OafA/YrhL
VAVILVLLYHADVAGFGGGYVGVDVFFVLSGFLITGLIYRELRATGRFSFTSFYARRARRLLPAAGVVLVATLIAAVVLLPGHRLPDIAGDIASAGLYVSNLRFGLEANDYFQATESPSPVLHFWSLSVEEQFYIAWPAILAGAFTGLMAIASRELRVAAAIAGVGLASLAAAIWLTGVNQPWAFFLLPTRAWELAVGGLLAVGLGRLGGIPPRLAGTATVLGVAGILAAAIAFDDATPFPGLAAILPVTGSALVILGGAHRAPLPARLLAVGPLRYLGRISYSVYLWHWPILLFGTLLLGPSMSIPLALVAIPVAAATQRWIEEPLRHGRFIGVMPRRNLLQAAGVGLAIVIASAVVTTAPGTAPGGGTVGSAGGDPASHAPSAGALDIAGPSPVDTGPRPCSDCTLAELTPPLWDLRAGRIPDGACDVRDATACVLGSMSPDAPVVALFGDSHAGNWTAALAGLATEQGWRFVHLTHGGCPSLETPVWSSSLNRPFTECDDWRETAVDRLEAERPDLIIITNAEWYQLVDGGGARVDFSLPPSPQWTRLWSTGFDGMLARVSDIAAAVAVIGAGPVPSRAGLDPVACVAQPTTFRACHAARDKVLPPAVHDIERAIAAIYGAAFLDPSSWMCDLDVCPAVIDTFFVYMDGSGHLTTPLVLSLQDRLLSALPSLE